MNLNEHFRDIRSAYAAVLPEWMADYDATGNMFNDPYLMDWKFSPIEQLVWGDIRNMALPFYPQLPALNYFLDFGNPFLKIGIECDGKQWHDKARDAVRDERLAAAGWMIFRIEGHECNRSVDRYWDGAEEDRPQIDHGKFFGETAEGVLLAIKHRYFDSQPARERGYMMSSTLELHRSTPETYPSRRAVTPNNGPQPIGEFMAGYLDLMAERLERSHKN